MGYPRELRQYAARSPPRAYVASAVAAEGVGQVIVIATTTSAAYLDLFTTTFGMQYASGDAQLAQGNGAPSGSPQGLVGVFVDIFADAQDLGVVFGNTAALVSGSGVAPSLTAAGTVAGGVYTAAAQACYRIPSGTSQRFLTQIGQDNFLGWVAAGSGYIRIYQSSAYGI